MFFLTLLLTLLSAAALPALAAPADPKPAPPAFALQEVAPPATDEPLMNPGMGVYLFGTRSAADMPADAWFSKIVTIGYFRDNWSKLVPAAEGQYQFDEFFNPVFDLWVKQWGKRVAFRFMSQSMHSKEKYVTPKWVFDAGVPGVTHKGLYTDEQIDPVFWDDRYLAIQERFIADLGKYLDGRPGLEFIDIGCIGEWGEMHLARWTPQQLQETGYTEAKYIAAYRRVIDAFARAFPRTRVFLNVGDYETLNDYAAIRGIHFRQDGLHPAGPSANVGKRFYHPYARRGILCNYELHSGYSEMKEKGWGIPETFAKGLEDPISYFHINLMGYKQLLNPPAEVKDSVTDLARRLGYRFVVSRLRCNQAVRLDGRTTGRLLLEHTWKNEGVAPCYDSYALRFTFVSAEGREAAGALVYPKKPTTLWWPGEEVALQNVVAIPGDLPPGTYTLKVAMVKPEEPALRVQLGLAGRDADGAYVLAQVPVEKVAPRNPVVHAEGFANGSAGWSAAAGMTATVDPEGFDGKACLLVSGSEAGKAWSLASANLKEPILPASRYRISCRMKVERIDSKRGPYLKIGLTDAAGKWITNWSTGGYDVGKLGTWQLLEGYAETTPETAGGHLAIEKGTLEAKVTATLRLADVKVELLESP